MSRQCKLQRRGKLHRQSGFTLIEVMIAVTIMAALMALTSQSVQQAVRSKLKIQTQVDQVTEVRDALRLIEKDINLAFHYRDLEEELRKQIKEDRKPKRPVTTNPDGSPRAEPESPPEPPSESELMRKRNRVNPTTHFAGKDEAIHFVTLNAARMKQNSAEPDFGEVGYYLDSCRSLKKTETRGKCLFRRFSFLVDDDITTGGDSVQLLSHVTEFKLRYFGSGKQDWVNDWESGEKGDAVTKDHYPEAVEISLTLETPQPNSDKTKKISVQIVAAIYNPNNPPKQAGATP